MRIAYVGGWMRSGTTLLCEMVGAFEGALAIGELSGLWRAADRDEPCSCGALILECPVWRPSLDAVRARHGVAREDYGQWAALTQQVLRTRAVRSLASLRPGERDSWPAHVRSYVDVTHTLLASVSEITGAGVIVDSSKLPPGFLLARLMPDTEVDLLHIIRDPRAVANSERKTRVRTGPDAELLPPGHSATVSVAYWSGFNLTVKAYSSYARTSTVVDYEDLTSRTDEALNRIAEHLRLTRVPGQVLGGGHIAVGNPARFGGETRQVRPDDSWRREMPLGDRLLVSAASWPARLLLGT